MSQIAILGAGPAGLTLARLLERSDVNYTVFERDESASWAFGRSGSGTLDLHTGTGLLALEEAGLLEKFKELARQNVPSKIANSRGRIYLDTSEESNDDKPEIDRRDLREMLLKSVPAEKIQWGSKVQEVVRTQRSIDICLEDGRVESGFTFVVGADGAWSKARRLVTDSKPAYHGVLFLTTSITPSNTHYRVAEALAGKGIYIALGDEKSLVVAKLGNDTYSIGLGLRLPETWRKENECLISDPKALRRYLLERFSNWSEQHRSLIEHSEGDFHAWPQYSFDPTDLHWTSHPDVTLIGDAAHLTVTDGEGVNAAMYDAYQLSQAIVDGMPDDLGSAVALYEKEMLERARVRLSRAIPSFQKMFSSEAPLSWIRSFGE